MWDAPSYFIHGFWHYIHHSVTLWGLGAASYNIWNHLSDDPMHIASPYHIEGGHWPMVYNEMRVW